MALILLFSGYLVWIESHNLKCCKSPLQNQLCLMHYYIL